MAMSLIDDLPEYQKKYLHPDFIESEQAYWSMRDQLARQYQGQWVAIYKGQVVASGELFNVMDEVGKHDCHAYITKVGEENIEFKVRRQLMKNVF
ncbi:MAG: hypothetical protein HY731_08535 [Candidatus Tectomicrobia bacterium]|nr:hypothetical protein [Candidatus Tectomicrobia bacterium]